MTDRHVWLFLCLITVMPLSVSRSDAKVLTVLPEMTEWAVLGTAVAPDSGDVLYREFHFQDDSGLTRHIHYLDRKHSLLVTKWFDYPLSPLAPDFVQLDLRTEAISAARWSGSSGEMTHLQLVYKQPVMRFVTEQKWQEIKASDAEQLVIDAGFDAYIRRHWDALLAGERRVMAFALPARGRIVDLRISRLDNAECAVDGDLGGEESSDEVVCFKAALDNWLLAMWVKPLLLSYELSQRRLRQFVGISNIDSDSGESQQVRIRYRYAQQ